MRIAVLDDYQHVARGCADWDSLKASEVTFFSDHVADHASLVRRLAPFEAIVAMRERTPFPAEVLATLPNLRLLVTTGSGNAAIDVDAARRRGITVCGTETAGSRHATSELTWGLVIALARGISREDAAVRAGSWQVGLGIGLHGRVLGILGLGHLGIAVANYGKAFGMEVIAWSPNLTPERAAAAGVRHVDREAFFRQADVVSIHMKLAATTRGLVGARELGWMKPSAFLINTSRGPLVDEASLVAALRERRIAGAGLDTFDMEPLPTDHPFLALDNVVLTPHIGYVTEETYRAWYGQVVEDIAAFARGEPIRVIEASAGYEAGIR